MTYQNNLCRKFLSTSWTVCLSCNRLTMRPRMLWLCARSRWKWRRHLQLNRLPRTWIRSHNFLGHTSWLLKTNNSRRSTRKKKKKNLPKMSLIRRWQKSSWYRRVKRASSCICSTSMRLLSASTTTISSLTMTWFRASNRLTRKQKVPYNPTRASVLTPTPAELSFHPISTSTHSCWTSKSNCRPKWQLWCATTWTAYPQSTSSSQRRCLLQLRFRPSRPSKIRRPPKKRRKCKRK